MGSASEARYGDSPTIQNAALSTDMVPQSRRKVVITKAMADKLNPKPPLPESEGTESRGVDPMTMRGQKMEETIAALEKAKHPGGEDAGRN